MMIEKIKMKIFKSVFKRICKCGWKGSESKCKEIYTGTGTLSNPTDIKYLCPKCNKKIKQIIK